MIENLNLKDGDLLVFYQGMIYKNPDVTEDGWVIAKEKVCGDNGVDCLVVRFVANPKPTIEDNPDEPYGEFKKINLE